jgi:hypothetical protein
MNIYYPWVGQGSWSKWIEVKRMLPSTLFKIEKVNQTKKCGGG